MNEDEHAGLIVWVDIETTGLEPAFDRILEIGLRLTDWYGGEIARFDSLVWSSNWINRLDHSPLARAMHQQSGLVDDLLSWDEADRVDDDEVQNRVVQWFTDQQIDLGLPMAGSSVHFDRSFLVRQCPRVHELFGYRNLDVSSTREQMKIVNRVLYDQIPELPKAHRPQSDIDNSIALWKWMIDNFFWV